MIYCEFETFHLEGKAVEELLSRAVYNHIYSNKVKDKQEKQVTHTHNLIQTKNFYGRDKRKQREGRHYEMISSREVPPCVPFCLLSS